MTFCTLPNPLGCFKVAQLNLQLDLNLSLNLSLNFKIPTSELENFAKLRSKLRSLEVGLLNRPHEADSNLPQLHASTLPQPPCHNSCIILINNICQIIFS